MGGRCCAGLSRDSGWRSSVCHLMATRRGVAHRVMGRRRRRPRRHVGRGGEKRCERIRACRCERQMCVEMKGTNPRE